MRRWWWMVVLLSACGDPADPSRDGGEPCASSADCDDGVFCNGIELCSPSDPAAGATGCVPGDGPPCIGDCDEEADTCIGGCTDPDQDRDGVDSVACGGTDCDDRDPNRFPGNAEVCDENAHDEDCDPETVGFDFDGDGFFGDRCCNDVDGELTCGTDCDDLTGSTFPDASDICNGVDDDCDGDVDEGATLTFYFDGDGDGFGLDGPDLEPEKRPITGCERPDGYALIPGDCNDESPFAIPGGTERCTPPGIDEDCDGEVDEYGDGAESPAVDPVIYYRDDDGDGFGQPADIRVACAPPDGYTFVPGDCRDDLVNVYPGQSVAREPQCPPNVVLLVGGVSPVVPALCDGTWACVSERGCTQPVAGPRYVPHWDLDCDGDVTGVTQPICTGTGVTGCGALGVSSETLVSDPLVDCGTGTGYFIGPTTCSSTGGIACTPEGPGGPGTRPCH